MNTWETVRLQGTIENTTEKYPKFLGIQSLRGKKPTKSTSVKAAPEISRGKDLSREMHTEIKVHASTTAGLPSTL